jgi:ribosome-binding factor A
MRVDVEPDLKRAEVHITVLPFDRSQEVLTYLIRNRKRIQKSVNKALTMKFSPEIYFITDNLTETATAIERLIDEEAKARGES